MCDQVFSTAHAALPYQARVWPSLLAFALWSCRRQPSFWLVDAHAKCTVYMHMQLEEVYFTAAAQLSPCCVRVRETIYSDFLNDRRRRRARGLGGLRARPGGQCDHHRMAAHVVRHEMNTPSCSGIFSSALKIPHSALLGRSA